MNWYRKSFKMRPMYFQDFPWSSEPLLEAVDEPASPSFEEWMAMIQGIEMWLSDPTGQQNITEDSYDIWCDMMREGLA
jgi:hypothetical protein